MAEPKIATKREFRTDAHGVERLVAAPGEPMPSDDELSAAGYSEAIDLRADTADAKLADGMDAQEIKEHYAAKAKDAQINPTSDVPYADPIAKVGEEGDEEQFAGRKSRKKSSVEDKAAKPDDSKG